MSDEDLIGYLFDLLDPTERAQVAARVQTDPAVATRLAGLRAVAAPLLAVAEVDRQEPPAPRPGLAVRAVARVAEYVVEHDPIPPEPSGAGVEAFVHGYDGDSEPPDIDIVFGPGTRAPVPAPPPSDGPEFHAGGRFRADLVVAAGIALVGVGLLLSGVAKVRHNSRAAACQNSLVTLYKGLEEHATHDPQGRYPQVGTPDLPTAGALATWLTDRGHLPAGFKTGCPATTDHLAYTYTLGFRAPDGTVIGLRKPAQTDEPTGASDLMPISADLPTADAAPAGGPLSPHGRTMNVLFVGGHVRPVTSPLVGPHGDDIYRNKSGLVAAGTNHEDAVLGRTGDRP